VVTPQYPKSGFGRKAIKAVEFLGFLPILFYVVRTDRKIAIVSVEFLEFLQAVFQIVLNFDRFIISIDVCEFIRIGFEIIHFPLFTKLIEMH